MKGQAVEALGIIPLLTLIWQASAAGTRGGRWTWRGLSPANGRVTMRIGLRSMPEIWIAVASLAVMLAFALLFSLPIVIPSGERAAFVGIHYIYPLIGIAILGLITLVAGKRDVAVSFLVALPCYIAVLFAHFHLKLWIPHINGQTYDGV